LVAAKNNGPGTRFVAPGRQEPAKPAPEGPAQERGGNVG